MEVIGPRDREKFMVTYEAIIEVKGKGLVGGLWERDDQRGREIQKTKGTDYNCGPERPKWSKRRNKEN